jgi:hypothetical protein
VDPPSGNKRCDDRYRVHLTVHDQRTRRPVRLEVDNLSRGGLFVRELTGLLRGERIQVKLDLPGLGRFQLGCHVMHVMTPEQAVAHGRSPGIGLSVTEMPADYAAALESYLELVARRGESLLLVAEEAVRPLLAAAGFQVAPAPAPAELPRALRESEVPVAGVVVPPRHRKAFAAAAAAAGADELVVSMAGVADLGKVISTLDATRSG